MVKLKPQYRDRFDCDYGPDLWACEFLDELGSEIKKRKFDGTKAVEPIRFATASGHGIGKSTLVAWLIKFILDTRPMSRGIVTANTADQLRTKTWAELAKWNFMSLTGDRWNYNNGRGSMSISRRGTKDLANGWRCDAQTCREENSEAFAGLHAAGSTPFYIFDEASNIADKIFEVREGGATDGEPMVFDFGNPTRNTGRFYENCVGKFRHRYKVRTIDSRNVAITNKGEIETWRQDWGEDSDFFKVRVKGEFPNASSVQFMPGDAVRYACSRPFIEQPRDAALLIGVDVARFGDDSTVIYPRLGLDARTWGYREYRGLDNVQVAEKVIALCEEFKRFGKKPSGIFVDGGGLGSGVVDVLRHAGYNPIDVVFNKTSTDQRFALRVDEIWGKLRDDIIGHRLFLPNSSTLEAQLTQREFGYTNTGKMKLESKSDMKDRGLSSPDLADALALTYALTMPNTEENPMFMNYSQGRVKFEYDPLSRD